MQEDIHATKLAILKATERLVAANGFEATSLRAITAAAKVNLAAVNYHFSTKDALILAMLNRRLRPVNEARLALLDQFEEEAGENPVTVEKILEALFRPVLDVVSGRAKGGRDFLRLLALALAEPGAYLKPLVEKEFSEKTRRFHHALRRTLPGLSEVEAHWRLHFAHGVFFHAVVHSAVLECTSKGRCRITSAETVLRRIVGFCAAGLRNPA
ncbi:MAG: TetR/AcrR family transcriptional regulator [Chthoniobacterales bacterium]|nr:TetR/AcrR family transcriptional regulator [Chthoniobacterales bacterium]